jgi:tRNA uridine 5-carboxymethylaminomethyl modification enzyme
VQAKERAAAEIDRFFKEFSVEPGQVNQLLEAKGTAPLRQKVKFNTILSRPQLQLEALRAAVPEVEAFLQQYDQEFVDLAEINLKYEGYIRKEEEMVEKMNRLERVPLREEFDYHQLNGLSAEAREKLTRMQPRTIGQASRISGVSPADISVLLVHMGR